jgi:acyl CoA:acetate/3-ketoacid CoA transferase beta subunit
MPVGVDAPEKVVGSWNPYRSMFDMVWSGRRHVMMGGSQFDKWGNQNFAFIGNPAAPKTQLLGMRGAPGNTINDRTSFWIPAHSTRVFVPAVSVVSGVGYDRAAELGEAGRFHELVRVVTNLCVIDFDTPDHRMRLRSVHPGVTVDEVVAATGFELVRDGDVPESRLPTDEELHLIREVIDPNGLGEQEVPASS